MFCDLGAPARRAGYLLSVGTNLLLSLSATFFRCKPHSREQIYSLCDTCVSGGVASIFRPRDEVVVNAKMKISAQDSLEMAYFNAYLRNNPPSWIVRLKKGGLQWHTLLLSLYCVKATAANASPALAQQAVQQPSNGPEPSLWAISASYLSILPVPIWAAILSVAAIIIAAVFGARWQRRIARETLTFNTIERQLWDGDYITTRAKFILVRDGKTPEELRQLTSKENAKTEEAASMRAILNNYELLSLGMMTGVLDAEIYKRYFRKTFVSDYEMSKPFIDGIKARSPRAYKEYTSVYEKWRENGSGTM